MRLSRPNQKGFISMELFLIVMVAIIVGGTGYFVYQATKKTNDTFSAAAKAADSSPETKMGATTANETADWRPYSGAGFSFKYPPSWSLTVCDAASILIGPSSGSAGHCNSESIAQIQITVMEGDEVQNALFKPIAYPDLQLTSVKVSGAPGKKQTATLKNETDSAVGLPNGTKVIGYLLLSKGKTFNFSYSQTPSQANVSNQFEQIVNKTLKFE
jgi:hypothetical protein